MLWPVVGKVLQAQPIENSTLFRNTNVADLPGNATDHKPNLTGVPAVNPPDSKLPVDQNAIASDLVLRNPRRNGGMIRFLVDGQEYALSPGQVQELSGNGSWRIEFHRGGEFGEAAHSLVRGAYYFTVTSAGWQLMPEKAN
jgi:hypothetical protein